LFLGSGFAKIKRRKADFLTLRMKREGNLSWIIFGYLHQAITHQATGHKALKNQKYINGI
jgi:hypothetical protein